MKRIIGGLAILLILLALPRRASAAPTSRPARFEDSYSLLLSRNIFSRSRSSGYVPSNSSRYTWRSRDAYRAQQAHVLTGLVEQEGNYVAFIEDTRSGETKRFRKGDTLAEGKISKIGFDFLEFEGNGAANHIEIGMNLDGVRVVTMTPPEASPTTSPTTAPTLDASGAPVPLQPGTPSPASSSGSGSNDVLERLRQNRLRELQK